MRKKRDIAGALLSEKGRATELNAIVSGVPALTRKLRQSPLEAGDDPVPAKDFNSFK